MRLGNSQYAILLWRIASLLLFHPKHLDVYMLKNDFQVRWWFYGMMLVLRIYDPIYWYQVSNFNIVLFKTILYEKSQMFYMSLLDNFRKYLSLALTFNGIPFVFHYMDVLFKVSLWNSPSFCNFMLMRSQSLILTSI